jgi:secreted PhoX family phosphatase
MGFFSHEAIDIDPHTGIAYLTEDDFQGDIPDDPRDEQPFGPDPLLRSRSSFLYRYIPDHRLGGPGSLHRGGRLQALKIDAGVTRNADLWSPRKRVGTRWVDVRAADPHEDALKKGCVRFNRLEGCHFAGGAFWFDDTAGGENRLGQIFRYFPATGTLELFYEGTAAERMESPDNLIVTPWGDLWFAEDGDGGNRVMGVTPGGAVYQFANNALNSNEFAGPTFAPDGRTFFVNMQGAGPGGGAPDEPGITFAIWGPFGGADLARQRQMASAAPPAAMAPAVSGELAEAAQRHGLTELEAAAYQRLGADLA